MVIRLNENYEATLNTALLGYVGETNARHVSVEGMEVDGADRYVLTIDYGDGVQYEVDITGGQWTPTADILRSAQTVSCQICAKKLSGDEYILVKKSRIFRLRIGAAIGDNAVPSPSVAADALDRISAIGEQVEADVERAENAASTAMQAAENAKKSATAAEKSADTATQAASRAETAKISAAQASVSAQQTTADKNITAGYVKTAKTCADSTTADRQAVQDMATQVTADKAIVADHAAQVATDRKAAETAAQTAQAVADSLPDDYTTAVGKIAENTAEIANLKLTDKELQRRVNALYDIGQGITHQFETDSETAYAKTVPTGAKLMSVKSVGGRSIVFNQMVDLSKSKETTADGVTFTFPGDGIVALNGTSNKGGNSIAVAIIKNVKDHKYLIIANPLSGVYGAGQLLFTSQVYGADTTGHGAIIVNGSSNATWYYTLYVYEGVTYDNVKLQPQIYDLTAMFGAGNEPSTVEEFEKIFPAAYYSYNAGEVVSAGVAEVVEQGKNLWDEVWEEGSINYKTGLDTPDPTAMRSKNYIPIIPNSTYIFVYTGDTEFGNVKVRFYDHGKNYIGGDSKSGDTYPNKSFITPSNAFYVRFTLPPKYGNIYKNDIALIAGSSGTYAPYHRNVYQIPETIKALPGYGIEGNTADYEAKTYTQNNAVEGAEIKALETPIVTDISSLIPDDFLRNIEVEAGGSVTFKNSNDSYRIPVPNEEEYVVKLSEVGGTT